MTSDADTINHYHRDGVLRRRDFFSATEITEIRAAYERYRSVVTPTLATPDYTLESDRQTVRNFWRMHEHDEFFRLLAERRALVELVAPLVKGEPVLAAVETFNKPAYCGSGVPPHQDNAYFCQSPPDMLTVWIALDPATAENGAVEYFLGSHHKFWPHKPSGVQGNSVGLADETVLKQFPVYLGTVEPGDVLIHHCQVIHRSMPNRSARPRLSLVIVYRGAHTQTDERMQVAYRAALAAMPQHT